MPALPHAALEGLLRPYLLEPPDALLSSLSLYLDLLLKWNARTNLTAIRDPEEIVSRHFGESLFAGSYLGTTETLLDFGSGAGFPGLPIALLRPDLRVTLAESQSKKAAFLREVIRSLGVSAAVWPRRVEDMPETTVFDCVTLRAVDSMDGAIRAAGSRAAQSMLLFSSVAESTTLSALPGLVVAKTIPMPNSTGRVLVRLERQRVRQVS